MKSVQVALVVLLVATLVIAEDQVDSEFKEANRLFQEREYEAAADKYREILNGGFSNETVEFNLGNCLYRLGELGQARLHYERAARLSPNDPDINYNISFIEQRYLKQTLREENFATIDRVLWRTVSGFPQEPVLIFGIAAYLALNLLLGIRIFKSTLLHPALFWTILIVLFLSAVFSISVSVAQVTLAESTAYGIIVGKNVDTSSEPEPDAPSSFPAPEAMKVLIERQQGDWIEIVLPNGSKGWVPQDLVSII